MPRETFFKLAPAKRDRIVAMAIEEFAERPYGQASLSRLVVRAGIAKGSIYQYFENKFDLYRWLVMDYLEARKREVMAVAAEDDEQVFKRLERMYLAGVRFMLEQPQLARLAAWTMDPSSDPDVQALHIEMQRMGHTVLRDLLAQAQHRGEIAAHLDVDLAAHVVGYALGSGLTQAVCARLGTDLTGLLHRPASAAKISDAELRGLVAQAVHLLREGLAGGPQPAGRGENETASHQL